MNRSTLLLLGLLLVLGAIVLFILPRDEEQMVSYDKTPVTFAVDSASVIKLSIERPGRHIVIENVGGAWTITSHGDIAADPARVLEVVGGLSRFRSGSLVSTNPAKQPVFQVDSSGSLVTLTERSGATRSIVIGKMGPSFSEVYFRLPEEANVYLGSGITTWSLDREVKDWRNRTIFAAPAEAITGLSISSGGRSREFVKDSSGWTSAGEPVPTGTINPVLTSLADLRAEDFIDSTVQFSGAPSTVTVSGSVAGTIGFYRLAGDTGRYAVTTTSSPQNFIVGRYAAAQLLKPVGDPRSSGLATIRGGAPAAATPAAIPTAPPPTTASQAGRRTPTAGERATGTEAASGGEAAKGPTRETAKERTVQPSPEKPGDSAPSTVEKPSAGGAINPFRQKPASDRAAQPPAVTTPPAETRTGAAKQTTPPAQAQPKSGTQAPVTTPPAQAQPSGGADDEGELTVHVVQKGETMTTIARKYGVTVEQILKWNLLKSILVTPGQELYVFVRK